MVKRILVVAPHADDEVIGCGGAIARASDAGANVTLVVMATGGIKHYHSERGASTDARVAEMIASAKVLGIARSQVLFPGQDMHLERIAMLELVTHLDRVLREDAFDECYIPEFNHNRDHQLTHDAAIAALRPAGARSPALIAAYESTVSDLQSATLPRGTFYVDIAATFERKVAALREYKTQVREYPHPVSEEGVRRLAAMRGLECGLGLAERFRVLRMLRT